MKKLSNAIIALSLCSCIMFVQIKDAKATVLPSPLEAILDLVADIEQILITAGQIEEYISLTMTTFDYNSGKPLKMDISAMWGSFDPAELVESSSMIDNAVKGIASEASAWYSSNIGLDLGSFDFSKKDIIENIKNKANDLYKIPPNPSDEKVAEIKKNVKEGIKSIASGAFGLGVSLTQKYKYDMEDYMKFDKSFLTSDDTSVAKSYSGLAKMNAMLAIAELERIQITAKETERDAMYNMYVQDF